jgi:hypothetical protein
MNLYLYVSANPLVLVDPMGLWGWDFLGKCLGSLNPWSWAEDRQQWETMMRANQDLRIQLLDRQLADGVISQQQANFERATVAIAINETLHALEEGEADSQVKVLETTRDAAIAVGTAPIGGALVKGASTLIRGANTGDDVLKVGTALTGSGDDAARAPTAYSTFSEQAVTGTTRQAHRTAANRQLYGELQNDPALRATYNRALGTDVMAYMQSGKSGLLNPPGMVWHHPVGAPGVVHLVPQAQHVSPAFQAVMHPNGIGGFAMHW